MPITEIKSPTQGLIGYLHEVEVSKDNVLVFQLPRPTNMLSDVYISNAKAALEKSMPPGKTAILIGADVNIYELAGTEALTLKLKGLL